MQITLTQLRRTPAVALDAVRDGQEVLVTEDGNPLMRLVPAGLPSAYERMLAAGTIIPPKVRPTADYWTELRAAVDEVRRGA